MQSADIASADFLVTTSPSLQSTAMAAKCLLLLAMVTIARGGIVASPLVGMSHAVPGFAIGSQVDSYDLRPQYNYAYDVQDSLTGDSKTQHEIRDGDIVRGSYSLVEPDGTRRIVDYTADSLSGFNAVVRKEPVLVKATVAATPVALVRPSFAVPRPLAVAHAQQGTLFGYARAGLEHGTLGLAYH